MRCKKHKNSLWRKFLRYVRRIEVGKTFTRQEMMNTLDPNRIVYRNLDKYRLFTTEAKYLKIVDRGVYLKQRKIPIIPKNRMVEKGYTNSWKNWFVVDKYAR